MNTSAQSELDLFLESENMGDAQSVRAVSGGSINDAYRLETSEGRFFLKINHSSRYPNMFDAEKRGLELLCLSAFKIPRPIATATVGDYQFMLMEWIEKGVPKRDFWNEFGRGLAALHSISGQAFGLDHDNYIGSLPQSNRERQNWSDFYREERLTPQMNLAKSQGRLTTGMKIGFDGLFEKLETIFPVEKPSLIHGDLWSGNLMVADSGSPSIFDPAVYFGHREMDLAMMALFGGFGNDWVDAYNEVYPLENGWRERIPIGQLYPLMVHVNLFGGSYGRDVESILKRFV